MRTLRQLGTQRRLTELRTRPTRARQLKPRPAMTNPLPTEEGAQETEQTITEARVVPDEKVEQELTVAPDASKEVTPEEEPRPAVIPPSFDIVRITPDGRAVIAGHAPPGAEVTVKSESVDLGSETANLAGEWTLVPYVTIPPGNHQFSAIATLPDGTQVESDQVLVVSVPEPDEDEGSVLALLMPRDGDGTSTVLQKPKPAPEKVEPEPAPEVADEERIELARPDTTPEGEAAPDTGTAGRGPSGRDSAGTRRYRSGGRR